MNDGYYFCQNDSKDQIRHAYTSRLISLNNDYKAAITKLKDKPILDFGRLLPYIYEFYKAPLTYFKNRKVSGKNESTQLSDVPIKSMSVSKKYLNCDDPEIAKKAARITIQSWRTAAAILEKQGIPVWFVLQPTATFKPQEYKLDHIINQKKQAIVNEERSYNSYYSVLKHEFLVSCDEFSDCSSFIDLSELFIGVEEFVFIDTAHISPNGNEIVSKALISRLR